MYACLNRRYLTCLKHSFTCFLYFVIHTIFTNGFNQLSLGEFICMNTSVSSTTGTLFSDNFPLNYTNSYNCDTNISVNNAASIEVFFEYFHTESYSDLNLLNEMCDLDYLEIISNGRSLRLCGDWRGKENRLFFNFNSSFINIRFHSNENISRRGFVLKWASMLNLYLENPSSCLYSQYFLHETEKSCFEVLTKPESWLTSHEDCRRRGAILARIEDVQTQAGIDNSLFKRQLQDHSIWIGANDRIFEGDYMWTDRTALQYTNWFPGWIFENVSHYYIGQPSDDGFSNEDCVEMRREFSLPGKGNNLANSFFWNDRNCEEKNPYICQFDKQIYKRSAGLEMTTCGQIVNLTSKQSTTIITSPNYPNKYPDLVSCHTIITVPVDKQIYIDFLYFHIEDGKQCEFDNLTIFEPQSKQHYGPHCGYWNNKLKLLRLVSTSNELVITFQSDNTKQYTGFKVQVTLIDPVELCIDGGTEVDNLPARVLIDHNKECIVVINETSSYIDSVLTCSAIASSQLINYEQIHDIIPQLTLIENDCQEVWVTSLENVSVTDDPASYNDLMCNQTRVCKQSTMISTKRSINYTIEQLRTSCTDQLQAICYKPRKNSTVLTFTSASGDFAHFCLNGQNYSNDIVITSRFMVTPGYKIIFELHAIDIEYQEHCLYDYIQTSGMVNNAKLCGTNSKTLYFLSVNNTAKLQFTADSDVTGCGYNISWYSINTDNMLDIQYIIPDKYGILSSINYPKPFPDTIDQCINITISASYRLVLEIVNINLPGANCDESLFKIDSDKDQTARVYCGGTSINEEMYNRYILVEGQQATFCMKAKQLDTLQGVNITFRMVSKRNTALRDTVTLPGEKNLYITSLMYPNMIPALITQTTTFRTQIGFQIIIELHNITVIRTDNCTIDRIKIIDNSVQAYHLVNMMYSCINTTNETKIVTNKTLKIKSFLNSLDLHVNTGYHTDSLSSLMYTGIVRSVKDTEYLTKTKEVSGSFDECLNDTCQHGGQCLTVEDNRYKCSCSLKYTGLFCQVNKCDLQPCVHGACNLTDTGFLCVCSREYWGEFCSMNDKKCRQQMCSGNGQCVKVQQHLQRCLCDQHYTGEKCNIPIIQNTTEDMTIGQKLLKEPIWIGMIVIVNLVVFFCLAYVVRRKCGKKIARLFPKRSKPSTNNSKENSKGSTYNVDSLDRLPERSISSIHLETPKISTHSMYSLKRQISRDKVDSTSIPSTPVITEQNQDAALKLFASYNLRKDQLTQDITSMPSETITPNLSIRTRNVMSCGIKGGTLTLNRTDESDHSNIEATHGILRSYTVSGSNLETATRSKLRKPSPFKAFSYSGSPIHSNTNPESTEISKPIHCYPEIRIINEYDIEETKRENENETPDDAEEIKDNIYNIKPVENLDSGYPSTTVSNVTQSGSTETQSNKQPTTASEKRKLFSSKSKSASFYKISSADAQPCSTSDIHSSMLTTKALRPSTSVQCLSFESEVCPSCHRDSSFNNYSYEKGLDKLDRHCATKRFSSSVSSCCRHKRHRHKRSSVCRHRSSHRKNLYTHQPRFQTNHYHHGPCVHLTSRHLSLVEQSKRRRHHSFNMLNSSTESDSCLCSTHTSIYQGKQYHPGTIRESYSETDCYQGHLYNTVSNDCGYYQDTKADHVCKSSLMKSFLSDTYHAKYQRYPGATYMNDDIRSGLNYPPRRSSSTSSMEQQHGINITRHSRTGLERSIVNNDVDSSSVLDNSRICNSFVATNSNNLYNMENYKVNEDIIDANTSMQYDCNQIDIPRTFPQFSIDGNNDNDDVDDDDDRINSIGILLEDTLGTNDMKLKDSAYQTKQSSIDKYSKWDKSKPGSVKVPSNSLEKISNNDTVHRYLHQAALKLAMLKRLQTAKEVSKDSAINTFSEDDLSADEKDSRGSFRPLTKRSSGNLVFQLGGMSLSEVKEEHSGGPSKDTESYNTPNNEPTVDITTDNNDINSVTSNKEMKEFSKSKAAFDTFHMEETKV